MRLGKQFAAAVSRCLSAVTDVLYNIAGAIDSQAEAIQPEIPPTKTLFNPDHRQIMDLPLPYPVAMDLLHHREANGFHDSEICAFSDVAEYEMAFIGRGEISGPLLLNVADVGQVDASRTPVGIPRWVEEDGLQLIQCTAKRILLINSIYVFDTLAKTKAWEPLNALLLTGHGIPRAPTRRLLRRISQRFQIPVCLLDDNDTWGYFIYSLLKRGALDPADSCPFLACEDVRFVGLRAGEGTPTCWRKWEPRFSLRLQYLKRYECFSSSEWQAEFRQFEQQRHAADLGDYIKELGPARFVSDYLKTKIDNGDWLK